MRELPLVYKKYMNLEKLSVGLSFLMLSVLFIGYMLTTGLEILSDTNAVKLVIRICVVLLAMLIVFFRRRVSQAMIMFFILSVTLFLVNQNQFAINVAFLWLIVAALKCVNSRQFALMVFTSSLLSVVVHWIALATGVVSIVSVEIGDRVRYTLGFANANQLALIYFSLAICSAYYYLTYRTKTSLILLILCSALSMVMIYVSGSRTFLAALIVLTILLVFTKWNYIKRIIVRFGSIVPLVSLLLTVFLIANNNMTYNLLLSYRPAFFNDFLKNTSWLDYVIGWNYNTDVTVDNAYLLMLAALGGPLFVLLLVLISIRVLSVDPKVVPILAILLLSSVTESFLVRPEIPVSVIFFWLLFSGNARLNGCFTK